ncbi:hypothetical protein [Halorientalis salina]|uniref:hypothetical protein n=1 Tax=Halorientalis salina TaxID=2932266 RepID=UPI0010ABD3E5|nr:hypothetical protein [Halorientalis salina]
MKAQFVDEVWDELYDRVGADLRCVVQFEATSSEAKFRDDVREAYELSERQHILDETIVQQLSFSDQGEEFHAGQLRSFVRVFDSAWILTWRQPSDQKAGFLVSIQRDGDVATMNDVEDCIQYLNEEIRPRL